MVFEKNQKELLQTKIIIVKVLIITVSGKGNGTFPKCKTKSQGN